MGSYRAHALVCGGAGCISAGCKAVGAALTNELKAPRGSKTKIRVLSRPGALQLPILVHYYHIS